MELISLRWVAPRYNIRPSPCVVVQGTLGTVNKLGGTTAACPVAVVALALDHYASHSFLFLSTIRVYHIMV